MLHSGKSTLLYWEFRVHKCKVRTLIDEYLRYWPLCKPQLYLKLSVHYWDFRLSMQAVKSKEHSNRKRSVCILQSALESDEVGVIAASSLATIIATQEFNNRVKLGWCVIVREVVQGWSGSCYVEWIVSLIFAKCDKVKILVASIAEIDGLIHHL